VLKAPPKPGVSGPSISKLKENVQALGLEQPGLYWVTDHGDVCPGWTTVCGRANAVAERKKMSDDAVSRISMIL